MGCSSASLGQAVAPAPAYRTAPQPAATGPQPVPRAVFIQTMDAEFGQADADKNGILTKAKIESAQRSVALLTLQSRNRPAFAALDKDRNGSLSQAEFAALSSQPPPPNPDAALTQTDGNRDGQVTLVEYRAGKLVNFDKMDGDRDGIVSVAEMKAGGLIK